jgi:maltose/maltodextrin transport system substrate-binding protein
MSLAVCFAPVLARAAEKPATPSAETQNVQPDWSRFDWAKLNAQALAEYTNPVRPGIPGKFPFLNVRREHNQGHMYAPNFDFAPVPGAKRYRFTVAHWDGPRREYRVLVYESPVLPAGLHTLKLRVTNGYSVPDYVEIDTPSGEHATNTVRVNDATVGAGTNQFEYVGKWTHGRGAAAIAEACLEGDASYSNTAGDSMQIRFSGTRVRLYGLRDAHHGTGMVSVDDGKEREAVFRSDKKVLGDKTWVFEAAEPWASLTPVWTELPVCLMPGCGSSPNRPEKSGDTWLRLTVEGLDATGGKPIGKAKIGTAEMLEFRKSQPFQGPLEQPKTTLREACMQAIRHSMAEGMGAMYTFYKDHRLPIEAGRGPELAKRFAGIEPTFLPGGIVVGDSMTFLARESRDPDEVALALKTARNAADTIINTSNPPGWKYANFANMMRGPGTHWKAYLAGEKSYEEWLADMHAQSAAGYTMMWDSRSGDPGLMYLDMYDVTKDAKYLEAAKRLAAAWRDTQLPSGTWPYRVHPVAGESFGIDYPPALTIWFLDRLATQYGVRDYEQTADRAFQWVLENQVKPLDLRAHYWDATPGPRSSQGALAASEIAMCLFNRAARTKNAEYTAMGEEIVRWIEDWFIRWEADGTVLEQSRDRADVAFTAGGVVQAYVKAYEMTGNQLYLAKALRMANRLMGDFVNKSGYGWAFFSGPRAAVCLLEAYPFLKKNNLPGGE